MDKQSHLKLRRVIGDKMSSFIPINSDEALKLIEAGALIADIRDPGSFEQGHIKGALPLNNENLQQFIDDTEFDKPIIVCCYHGVSSQSAAAFLCERGFEQVYSLNGGFEGWALGMPEHVDRA